jgi:UDP:flavonoid glycosyltransferase YjiC (YdhE family)
MQHHIPVEGDRDMAAQGAFFAFLASPFPSHLGQMSLAVAELLRRGHRVEMWADESLRQTSEKLGAGFRLVPLEKGSADRTTSYSERPLDYYARFAFPLVVKQLPRILELCEKLAPNVIHSNSRIYTAAVASRLTGIPCSNHCCSGLSFGLIPEDLFGFHLSGEKPPRKRQIMIAMNRAFHKEVDLLFERIVAGPLAIAPVDNVLGLVSDRCVLALSCRELSNPRLAALPQTVFTGPLIADGKLPAAGTEGEYCYVSLGTWPLEPRVTIDLYRTIISGIVRKHRVVVGLGGRFEPTDLGMEDERVLVLKYAPQESMIRNADAVICHGGCQTVHEALYFGKPLVILPPSLAEPLELSHKVARAGAGVVLDYLSAAQSDVLRAVETVLGEESFRRSAESLGQLLRGEGGLDRAVEALERLAAQPASQVPEGDIGQPSHSARETR